MDNPKLSRSAGPSPRLGGPKAPSPDALDLWSDEFPEHIDDPYWPLLSLDELEAINTGQEVTYSDCSLGPVVIVDGYNVAVKVRQGQLFVTDGARPHCRERTISTLEAPAVRTVLVLGAGIVTTEAMLWCHHHQVALVVARTGGLPTMLSSTGLYEHARLRRMQALAPTLAVGLQLFKRIAEKRLVDMAELAGTLDEEQGRRIKAMVPLIQEAEGHNVVRGFEGSASKEYWRAWRSVSLTFRGRVPDHWRRPFEGRSSPSNAYSHNHGNRRALTPLNAMLNFSSKLAESQAALAMVAFGLDPGMGIGHFDPYGAERPSGALDVMEVARGIFEREVLRLAHQRKFTRADFRAMPKGELRVGAPLSHELAKSLVEPLRSVCLDEAEAIAPAFSGGSRRSSAPGGTRGPLRGESLETAQVPGVSGQRYVRDAFAAQKVEGRPP